MPNHQLSPRSQQHKLPAMDNWERDLVFELNETVDVHSLSRDVPRLKVHSPARCSIKNNNNNNTFGGSSGKNNNNSRPQTPAEQVATKKEQQEKEEKEEREEKETIKQKQNKQNFALPSSAASSSIIDTAPDRADRMCAALLHIEELCLPPKLKEQLQQQNQQQQSNSPTSENNNKSNLHSSSPTCLSATASPPTSPTSTSMISPLRQKSVELYPKFANDADLSGAFLNLLRVSQWLPSEESEKATSEETGYRQGKLPTSKLTAPVRILGTLSQSVIFAPSRRIAHLLWTPFSAHLTDVDWEVFILTEPWPSEGKASIIDNCHSPRSIQKNKNKFQQEQEEEQQRKKKKQKSAVVGEKSPLLANQSDDDDDDHDNNKKNDAQTPVHHQVHVASSSSSPDQEENGEEEGEGKTKKKKKNAPSETPTLPLQQHQQQQEEKANEEAPQVTNASSAEMSDVNNNEQKKNENENEEGEVVDVAGDQETIYVCHRIVGRNNVQEENIGRFPRFQVVWVLELHCGKGTGKVKKANIVGVRVTLLDDEEEIVSGSCGKCCSNCGASAEWLEKKEELEEKVQKSFGIKLEGKRDSDPY